MTNLLITGAMGQLGQEMHSALANHPLFNPTYSDIVVGESIIPLDITDATAVEQLITERQIDVIINCAAMTAVDAAEDNEILATKLNVDAVQNLATSAAKHHARMIHISTDYVFDGTACTPYNETHPTNPQSVYGATKLLGEQKLQEVLQDNYTIIRTSWLYSPYGKNFVKTMLQLGRTKSAIKVVFDQIGTPTNANDLARAIVTVLEAPQWHSGIYHYSNEGVISWYDFAQAIFHLSGITSCSIEPCHSDEFRTRATRPSYSVLDKTKFKSTYEVTIPYWEDSLREVVKRLI